MEASLHWPTSPLALLLAVLGHLGVHSVRDVDVERIGQRHDVHQHVREFLPARLLVRLILLQSLDRRLVVGPLEEFQQLAGFDADARRQVARRMVFLPMPLGDEFGPTRAELSEPLLELPENPNEALLRSRTTKA